MKFELESADIEAIAALVAKRIMPMLADKRGDDFLDVPSLADMLKVDPKWVYKQVSTKTLPYMKVGKYVRFSRRDIQKWLESNKVAPEVLLR